MSNFIEEHVNIDAIHDLGKVYTQELGNSNVSIRETGVKLSSNRTLLLNLGLGTTLPVVGEVIPELAPATDHLSMNVYAVADSMKTFERVYSDGYDIEALGYTPETWGLATHEDRCAAVARFTGMKRMKQRQSLTLDAVSHNSHGMIQFGKAKESQAPVLLDMNTYSFGHIDRQLSTFNMTKISREIAGVMFNKDNMLSLAVNREEIRTDFRGMIEYEILDAHNSSEYVLERKRLLITDSSSAIDYIPVTEGLFVDVVVTGAEMANLAEVIQSEAKAPVIVDDGTISSGEWFVINKTNSSMRVTLVNGQVISIDPFGIVKASASQPISITRFRNTYSRPSTVSGNVEGLLYKQRSRFDTTLLSRFYVEDVKEAIYEVSPSGFSKLEGGGQDYVFGPYKINNNFDNVSINQFGDNENAIYAIRVNNVDMYIDGDDVFAKDASDLNFTEVIMPAERVGGEYKAVVGAITFSTVNDVHAGSVHRDKDFMYESNFIISTSAVTAEVVGQVYPTTFFRIERVHTATCGNFGEYPLNDGNNNSKNKYMASEIALVYGSADGYISIANNRNVGSDQINYSYLAVAGKISDTPMIVESFGYVTRETMTTTFQEHFLSVKIRDSYLGRTRKRYSGLIEKINAPYKVMWIKLRYKDSDETTMLFEHEYGDEHAGHLGYSSYLGQRTPCDEPAAYGTSKLSWITNMLEYPQYWSKTSKSIVPASIELSELALNRAVGANQLSVTGSLSTRSIDDIDGIGVTALSAQIPTSVKDTMILEEPTIIRTDDTLHDRLSMVVVPKVGFFFYTEDEVPFEDILNYTESEILEPFKRGVLIEWEDYTLESYLEFRPEDTNVFSVYRLIRKGEEEDVVVIIEQPFPDGAISTDTMYRVDELYKQARDFTDYHDVDVIQKCIPMYLANTLMREYGHVQNIIAVWDESSGVIINDASISFEDDMAPAGHRVTPLCSGAEPIDVVDHYAMLSVYKTGKPYDVSDNVRVCISKSGVINGFEDGAMEAAEILFDDGDENGATKRTLDGITKNISGLLFVQVSPVLFGMQGPWKNPIDYVSEDEKILLSGELTYKIKPRSRLIMNFNVGPENTLHLDVPGRQFDEMYDIIDGYVEEEVVADEKRTPLQRGQTSYSLKYINHAGSGILLDRSIMVDLEAYPARLSYPSNNLTRELISPIREDGHSKKMDARGVYVRFDTRYVSESIHSYYDKFIEAPTALTCDSLPEEAVLSRSHDNDHSLYNNLLEEVQGSNLIATDGSILLSFDNDTDEVKLLTPVFDNTRRIYMSGRGIGVASFKLDDAYRLMKEHVLFRGASEENAIGRDKQDGKYVGSENLGV